MRSCDEILELISAALDDDLSGEEQAALEEHLSGCPACSALFTELSGLHAAAAQLEELPAPAGFAEQVMAHIANHPDQETGKATPFPAKQRSRSPWKGWAATAAVVAVVILGATALDGRVNTESKDTAADFNSAAAPASAETVTATTSADNGLTVFSLTPGEDGADQGKLSESTAESAEPESAFSPQAAGKAADGAAQMQDTYDMARNNDSLSLAAYCGVLTLTGGPLPEGLEEYEGLADSTGAVTYVVPADYFFSCLAQLEDRNTANFACADSGEETAEYGLIIVEDFS